MQGDVIAVTTMLGDIIGQYEYDAWGKLLSVTDANGADISSDASEIANINPIRYRGYYYDTETGLFYVCSRYYDPEIGRFINADNVVAGPNADSSILGTKLYAYCFNNPVNMSDPTGNWPRWITAAVAVVATVVAVVAAPAVAAVAATVAVVAAVTLVAQTIHYDVRQSKNTPLPDNKKAADEQKWDNSVAADLHQYSAKGKPKEEKN